MTLEIIEKIYPVWYKVISVSSGTDVLSKIKDMYPENHFDFADIVPESDDDNVFQLFINQYPELIDLCNKCGMSNLETLNFLRQENKNFEDMSPIDLVFQSKQGMVEDYLRKLQPDFKEMKKQFDLSKKLEEIDAGCIRPALTI
jgi:short-subunit dehydrogenase involved in D-alanine esterification of teichoic acids